MKETLIIKHAVGGRIFIDSTKQGIKFTLEKAGEGWKFTVHPANNSDMEELLRLKEELNVFVFQELADQPIRKTWFYVNEGPVEYDPEHNRLTVYAQSRIDYQPEKFLS
jgi:MoaA/NifB/PqqE/SkfB family radical SAM enzyme